MACGAWPAGLVAITLLASVSIALTASPFFGQCLCSHQKTKKLLLNLLLGRTEACVCARYHLENLYAVKTSPSGTILSFTSITERHALSPRL